MSFAQAVTMVAISMVSFCLGRYFGIKRGGQIAGEELEDQIREMTSGMHPEDENL